MIKLSKLQKNHSYVDKKIKRLLIGFFILMLIFIGIALYQLIIGKVSILWSIIWLVGGFLIGAIVWRAFKVLWDEKQEKVITRLDTIGIIILLLFVVLRVSERRMVWQRLDEVPAHTLLLISTLGIFRWRWITTFKGVRKVLEKEKVWSQ